jgi:2-aminoethylphosphonate-pyruvate transaminase
VRAILLNPGPVSLSDAVRKAAVSADLCHREPEFFNLQSRVRERLLDVYGCAGDEWAAVLLGGSGTTALEAMLASLPGREARLLVIENGVYGERISRIAEIHGISFQALRQEWTEAIDYSRVEEALAKGGFTHLAAVHHETTTGRLNDAAALARLCEQHGVSLLLDAVSSFGAEAIPFESPALAGCAVTANKCLHGIPGLCLVVARRDALEAAAEPPRTLYLHLPLWLAQQDRQSTPFTPPVNALLALNKALEELDGQACPLHPPRRPGTARAGPARRQGAAAARGVLLRADFLPAAGRHELRAGPRRPEAMGLRDLRGAGQPGRRAVPHFDDGRHHRL